MSESPRLRRARPSDAPALEAFDVGAESSPWLDEVRKIVSGLVSRREDPSTAELDREVVVLELNGEIVGVSAHEAVTNEIGQAQPRHRYLMVTAVRAQITDGVGWQRCSSNRSSRTCGPAACAS